ncbi:hypothetical protein ACE7GA_08760 [Roseomonas sp. CCTCC AB2023176]|uniref:hypothetical protein n=1 Tax=Roseomonas sp. CCTCC AB2023176 TaxID=3342640 RepID=UPI0035DDD225
MSSHDALRPVFDFDAFEGPDADAGRHTRIGATRPQALASAPLAASGWIGVEDNARPGEGLPFGFGIAAPIRGDAARLAAVRQAVARVLDGPGTIVWHQGNTRPGGPPIVATVTLEAGQRDDLRRRLAPCLGQPPRR